MPGNTKVGFAGPNFYGSGQVTPANSASTKPLGSHGFGTILTRGGLSETGSDAMYADQRITLIPSFRVNPAIKGVRLLQHWRHPQQIQPVQLRHGHRTL